MIIRQPFVFDSTKDNVFGQALLLESVTFNGSTKTGISTVSFLGDAITRLNLEEALSE